MMGDTIKYKGGYKYQLAETYQATVDIRPADTIHTEFIHLTRTGLLMIGQGYAWDGPSGPAIDTKNFMRGSLIHDALYQLMREGHLPKTCRRAADVELRRACAEDGNYAFLFTAPPLPITGAVGSPINPLAIK